MSLVFVSTDNETDETKAPAFVGALLSGLVEKLLIC